MPPNFIEYLKQIGEYDEAVLSPRGFKIGDRVELPEFEGNPREVGTVVFVPPQDGKVNQNMIVRQRIL